VFRVLLDRHLGALAARAEARLPRRLRRRVEVADVLQEVWWAAFSRRKEFEDRGPRSLRNWLLGILDNKVREAIRFHAGARRRAVDREVAGPDLAAGLPAHAPSLLERLLEAERLEAAAEALADLPPHYQEVIRLRRDGHLSVAEAAERLGRSPAAVKKLYGRALASLQRALEAREADEPPA
jgi:RNA polymerase sigma-70 factor (ECF subfamily)